VPAPGSRIPPGGYRGRRRVSPNLGPSTAQRRRASKATRRTSTPRTSRPTLRSLREGTSETEVRTPSGKYISPFRQKARKLRQRAETTPAKGEVEQDIRLRRLVRRVEERAEAAKRPESIVDKAIASLGVEIPGTERLDNPALNCQSYPSSGDGWGGTRACSRAEGHSAFEGCGAGCENGCGEEGCDHYRCEVCN
jgi:hypothetical protein